MHSIDETMNALNSDLHFLRSFRAENPVSKTVFFYHIPKTGGISFFNTLALAKQIHSKLCRIQPKFGSPSGAMARIDTQERMQNVAEQLKNNPTAKCEVIAGHVPFGTHEIYPREVELVTIIRDPIARVKSAYQYDCMRQQSTPSGKEFEEFIQQPEQQNVMTKQLGALDETSAADAQAEELVEQVLEAFDYVGDLSELKAFQEFYLSRLGLPCVAYERFNPNSDNKCTTHG